MNKHPYHEIMIDKYKDDVLEYIPGHIPLNGCDAYTMINPLWRVRDNGEEVILMLCRPNNQICRLCPESYQILKDYEESIKKKISWCIFKNGYAHNSTVNLYIHQLITGCHGNGKGTGTLSVDHINRDKLDNRKINLRIVGIEDHKLSHHIITDKYTDNEYIPGMKNPLWKVLIDGEEVLLMLCEPDKQICKLCPEAYSILLDYEKTIGKKLRWSIGQNGYANNSTIKHYIHQIIMGCYGNGKGTGTISVDHINRDKLDNRKINLRVVGQKEQISNSTGVLPGTKRQRQCTAKQLPEGITQNMLRKYVFYMCEVYDKKSGKTREFFRVENHPNAEKDYASSKSKDVSIFDKLHEANKIAEDLDNGILPVMKEKKFPLGVSISKDNQHLNFDRRVAENRYSIKMKLPIDYSIDEELEKLIDRVKLKYPTQGFFA